MSLGLNATVPYFLASAARLLGSLTDIGSVPRVLRRSSEVPVMWVDGPVSNNHLDLLDNFSYPLVGVSVRLSRHRT